MGQMGKDIAQVTVESDWWSKINWTQVVAVVCSLISVWTAGKLNVSPETQIQIVIAIQGIFGLLTIYLRRYTKTITPAAAESLAKNAG